MDLYCCHITGIHSLKNKLSMIVWNLHSPCRPIHRKIELYSKVVQVFSKSSHKCQIQNYSHDSRMGAHVLVFKRNCNNNQFSFNEHSQFITRMYKKQLVITASSPWVICVCFLKCRALQKKHWIDYFLLVPSAIQQQIMIHVFVLAKVFISKFQMKIYTNGYITGIIGLHLQVFIPNHRISSEIKIQVYSNLMKVIALEHFLFFSYVSSLWLMGPF